MHIVKGNILFRDLSLYFYHYHCLLQTSFIYLRKQKFALGRELFDLVCQCLELEESQYFGLAYYLNHSATRNSMVGTHQDKQDSSDSSFHLSSSSIDKSYLTKFCGFHMTNSFNPCKMYSNDTTYPGFNPFFIDVPVSQFLLISKFLSYLLLDLLSIM